ncbi:hypothetical protein [Sneathiella limimaris]|uniref:hypothetical protein n=1 Tax=Sneathiella limimaris TaxID=1964213 RepID=UPI00146D5502|nr:hypothetical protein [Sneathiella limimaris]
MTWDDYGITLMLGETFFVLSYSNITLFVLVFAGVLGGYFLFVHFFHKGKGAACSWRHLPNRKTKALRKWQCKKCGIEAYSTDKRPPKECKKGLKPVVY